MPSIKEKGSRPAKPQLDPLRKLSFGAINRKTNNARTAYPILPDPNGELAIITARIIERTAQIEAIEGALTIDKSELKTLATPFYFNSCAFSAGSLFARYHAAEALNVKEGIKPVPDFHTVRHKFLSPQQNLAINQVCPIIAMVKTKGRIKENA